MKIKIKRSLAAILALVMALSLAACGGDKGKGGADDGGKAETITLESSLVDDLGADSLDVVDLVMTLEDEFDMEIPDEDIENVRTVGDIVKYLEEHTA